MDQDEYQDEKDREQNGDCGDDTDEQVTGMTRMMMMMMMVVVRRRRMLVMVVL